MRRTDLGTGGLGRGEVKWEERLGDKRTGKRGGEVGRTDLGTTGRGGEVGRTDLGTSGPGRGEVKWEERTWGQADWEEGR